LARIYHGEERKKRREERKREEERERERVKSKGRQMREASILYFLRKMNYALSPLC
jgi:hypothetical protein